jgi:hypothetical protein
MERIRRRIAVALGAVIDMLDDRMRPGAGSTAGTLRAKVLDRGTSMVEAARSEVAERTGVFASAALRQPALAGIMTRVPIGAISNAAIREPRRRRPTGLQMLLVAITLTAIAFGLSAVISAIIRRRQAAHGQRSTTSSAMTTAPAKELVAIPIVTAEEPALPPPAGEVKVGEMAAVDTADTTQESQPAPSAASTTQTEA